MAALPASAGHVPEAARCAAELLQAPRHRPGTIRPSKSFAT
jgi:hypothetical protein